MRLNIVTKYYQSIVSEFHLHITSV